MQIDQIKNILIRGKYKEVFKHLKTLEPLNPKHKKEIFILEARFHDISSSYAKGTISYDQQLLEINRIRESLLEIIINLEQKAEKVEAEKFVRFRYLHFIYIATAGLVLLLFFNYSSYFLATIPQVATPQPDLTLSEDSTQQLDDSINHYAKPPNTSIQNKDAVRQSSKPSKASQNRSIATQKEDQAVLLVVSSNAFESHFRSKAFSFLRRIDNKVSVKRDGHATRKIELKFKVLRDTSTVYTNSIDHSLTLELSMHDNSTECFFDSYASKSPQVAYQSDSKADVLNKVINPLLQDIFDQIDQKFIVLCETDS
ncbi:MAG: hypothetical protein AAF798_17125 [Bacteroidota bacterium]